MSKKKTLIIIFILLIFGFAVGVAESFFESSHLRENDITKEVNNHYKSLYAQKEPEYLVYIYNKDCDECNAYSKEEVEKITEKTGLKIYKVDLSSISKEKTNDGLLLTEQSTSLFFIREGIDVYRFNGYFEVENIREQLNLLKKN